MYTLFSQTLKATANLFEISLRLPIHCAYFWSSLSYIIPQLPLFQVIREGTSPFYNSLLPHIKLKSITWSFIKARVQQLVGPTLQTENKELFFSLLPSLKSLVDPFNFGCGVFSQGERYLAYFAANEVHHF